jgi:hypothetical protein
MPSRHPTRARWKEVSFGLKEFQHAYLTGNFASAVRRYALIDRWPEPDPDVQWLAGGQLVGVMTLGSPMNTHVLTGPFPKLAPYRQSLELNRLVLLDRVPAIADTAR